MMLASRVLDSDTQERLDNWGRWARDCAPYRHLWYPQRTILAQLRKASTVFDEPRPINSPPAVNDTDAEHIELAVQKLYKRDQRLGHCLRCRWVYRYSGRELAKSFGSNKDGIWNLVGLAEIALQGMLWSE
jgi:hypothetical protein